MGRKNVLDCFVESYKPTAVFRQKVYKLVGGDDALTKYTDEDILVMLKNMADKLKYLDREIEAGALEAEQEITQRNSDRWALDNCS
jgi:hypothetical protein